MRIVMQDPPDLVAKNIGAARRGAEHDHKCNRSVRKLSFGRYCKRFNGDRWLCGARADFRRGEDQVRRAGRGRARNDQLPEARGTFHLSAAAAGIARDVLAADRTGELKLTHDGHTGRAAGPAEQNLPALAPIRNRAVAMAMLRSRLVSIPDKRKLRLEVTFRPTEHRFGVV